MKLKMKTPLELREEKKSTREQVAKAVGLSLCGYINIELGNRNPSFKVAKKIAHYFGMPVESIKFGKEIKKCSALDVSELGQPTGTDGN